MALKIIPNDRSFVGYAVKGAMIVAVRRRGLNLETTTFGRNIEKVAFTDIQSSTLRSTGRFFTAPRHSTSGGGCCHNRDKPLHGRITDLQITPNQTCHKSTESTFSDLADRCIDTNRLPGREVTLAFVWIGDTVNDEEEVPKGSFPEEIPYTVDAFNRVRRTFKAVDPAIHEGLTMGDCRDAVEVAGQGTTAVVLNDPGEMLKTSSYAS